MSRILALTAAAAMGLAAATASAGLTFEELTTDTLLAGQGGWIDAAGDTSYATVISTTPSHLTSATKVVRGGTTRDFVSLDTNAPLGLVTGDTQAIIEGDFRPGTGNVSISVGKDGSKDGNRGPTFGFAGNNVTVRRANPNNSVSQALGPNDSNADWYRLRLVIDFTANDGDGSATLLVKNLTDGEATFRTVITNVDLDIKTRMAVTARDPATWDSYYLDIASTASMIDNVHVVIPEPAGAGALGGLFLLTLRRWGR